MKTLTNKGMALAPLIAIIVGVLVVGGVLMANMKPEEEKMLGKGEAMVEEGEAMMEKGQDMKNEGEKMMDSVDTNVSAESDVKMDKDEATMSSENEGTTMEETKTTTFTGKRLAGSEKVPLIDFNEADYKKALESDKLVALFFYASWCPSCRLEFPKMEKAFDTFTNENVVGFRVNYKDSDTTDFEEGLAREFGVGYQHTKVFIKNGERILKSTPEGWSTDEYITNINNNL